MLLLQFHEGNLYGHVPRKAPEATLGKLGM